MKKRKRNKSVPEWKPERFEKFWEYYRTHGRDNDRAGAVREWDRLKPEDDLIDTMARALAAQAASDEWRRGIGIPYACRWLRNERWRDTGLRRSESDTEVILQAWRLSRPCLAPCLLTAGASGRSRGGCGRRIFPWASIRRCLA